MLRTKEAGLNRWGFLSIILLVALGIMASGLVGCWGEKDDDTITGSSGVGIASATVPNPAALEYIRGILQPDGYYTSNESQGTVFEFSNHPCFPGLTITSSESINLILHAITNTISFHIEATGATTATDTTLTISGLEAFFTNGADNLCRYQDGVLVDGSLSVAGGQYTYVQSLDQLHHVFIQPVVPVIEIWGQGHPDDMLTQIGQWLAPTRCQITTDLNQGIIVHVQGIIIDGDGHTLNGLNQNGDYYGGAGIYLVDPNQVVIKNFTFNNCAYAVFAPQGKRFTIMDNQFNNNWFGIYFANYYHAVPLNNIPFMILSNTFSKDVVSVFLVSTQKVFIQHNQISQSVIGVMQKYCLWCPLLNNTIEFCMSGFVSSEGLAGRHYIHHNTIGFNMVGIVINNDGTLVIHPVSDNAGPFVSIYQNNIYNNTEHNIYIYDHVFVKAPKLSFKGKGNFWGHTQPDYFIPGTDCNNPDITDNYPYGSKNAWLYGIPPGVSGPTPDRTPPVNCVATVNQGNYTQDTNITLTLAAQDPESDVYLTRFSINDKVSWWWFRYEATANYPITLPEEDGIYTIGVEYRNGNGLVTRVTDTVIFDTTPPGPAQQLSPANGAQVNFPVVFAWEESEEYSPSYELIISTSQDQWWNNPLIHIRGLPQPVYIFTEKPAELDWNTTYYWGVIVKDAFYTSYSDSAFSFFATEIAIPDTTAPVVTISSPEAQDYYQTQGVIIDCVFSATDPESGVAQLTATLNGNPVTSGASFDATSLPLGANILIVMATNNAGLNATESVTFNIVEEPEQPDTTPPIVTITSPEAQDYEQSEGVIIECVFSAHDLESGIAQVTATLNGQAVNSGDSFEATLLPLGQNILTVLAVNNVGITATDSVIFNIIEVPIQDTTPPVVTITSPEAGNYYQEDGVVIGCVFSVEDPESGIAQITATLNGQPVASGDSFPTTELPLGENVLMVIAVNNAGISATDYVVFNIVETPSDLSIEELMGMVDTMYMQGLITKHGVYNALISKLNAALTAFNNGNYAGAINHLESFCNQVEAQRDKHIIDVDAAQELLDYTAALIEYLAGL